jgi:hypothetical protein
MCGASFNSRFDDRTGLEPGRHDQCRVETKRMK